MRRRAVDNLGESLRAMLNSFNREAASNTPDFLLAEYMLRCLEAYEIAVKERDKWYGIAPKPGQKS